MKPMKIIEKLQQVLPMEMKEEISLPYRFQSPELRALKMEKERNYGVYQGFCNISIAQLYERLTRSPWFSNRTYFQRDRIQIDSMPVSSKSGQKYLEVDFFKLNPSKCAFVCNISKIKREIVQ